MPDDRILTLRKPGEGMWLLVGVTVPPEPDAPELDNRCGHCESALARAALTRPLALHGIHCGHCGRVSRAKWVDEQEGKP